MDISAMIMEFPWLKFVFSIMTLSVIVMGCLINFIEKKLPTFMRQTFRYGKMAYHETSADSLIQSKDKHESTPLMKPIEVPKRWFKHFYVFAALYTTTLTAITIVVYYTKSSAPIWLEQFLDVLTTKDRYACVPGSKVIVAMILLTLQCWRRFYETFCVSVFSKGRMNLTHYIAGFVHYLGAGAAILAGAPVFAHYQSTASEKALKEENALSFTSIFAVGVFLWAFIHQYRIAEILADLRKNKKGYVVSLEHKVPEGDWFEWVSSPHLLAEILMYTALSVLLWPNVLWRYVLVWVLCNQVETALLCHWWYKETFIDYPHSRKALIPFIL